MSKTLSIDIETYSGISIKDCGTYRYAEASDFAVILFSYSLSNGVRKEPVTTIDLVANPFLPDDVMEALVDPEVKKTAHNAFFERTCLAKYLKQPMPAEQWDCTMVKAATLGLPLKLEVLGRVLKLELQKETEGKALIKFFSVPNKVSKKDINEKFTLRELVKIFDYTWTKFCREYPPSIISKMEAEYDVDPAEQRQYELWIVFKKRCIEAISERDVLYRNMPHHDPEKWERYKQYNNRDVVVELEVREAISWHRITKDERELWVLDQKINDFGVNMDMPFIKNVMRLDVVSRAKMLKEATELTGLDNPNSRNQIMAWLASEMPEEGIDTLKKEDVTNLLKNTDGHENKETIDRVLNLRQELSKTSIKKYQAMVNYCCSDGRAHGLLQFYGANRTGRWAGRGIQFQNLRRIELKSGDLDLARKMIASLGTWHTWQGPDTAAEEMVEEIEMMWGNVSDVLSQLIRTAFIPKPGNDFGVADFSAIEARVISWLANEGWRLEVFRTHGKIYEASASKMFKVPLELFLVDKPTKEIKDLRQRGKVSELALGYQGGENALITMGALEKGLKQEELKPLVKSWRQENPNIVSMWYRVQEKAIDAVKSGQETETHGIRFYVKNNVLFIGLPSGRALAYWNPEIRENSYGEYLSYEGLDQVKNIWKRIDTYGGKLVENIVQAIARDCLAHVLLKLDRYGFPIAIHVHDEAVIDVLKGKTTLAAICEIMAQPIPWAKTLPLGADGFIGSYYKK